MTEILQDISPARLTRAIEENMLSLLAVYKQWPRVNVHDEAEVMWSISDMQFPLFNSIMRPRLTRQEMSSVISSIVAEARRRNVPLLWWTGPATQPADIGRCLEQHGFQHEGDAAGMALVLAEIREPRPAPPGLTVQVVREPETLAQWGDACAQGFGWPEFVAEAFCDFMSHADPKRVIAYLGQLDGQPVASSLLVLWAGVAGIYNVATVPEARRRGIGAAMTLAPLRDARDQGYVAGILQASKMGAGVYGSLGFEEYCKIGMYGWEPDAQSAGA